MCRSSFHKSTLLGNTDHRRSEVIIRQLFNLLGLKAFRYTAANFTDTDYRYDVYVYATTKSALHDAQLVFKTIDTVIGA